MGTVKTKDIKNVSRELFGENLNTFTSRFEDNKQCLKDMNIISSKRIRNQIAGCITRTVKRRYEIKR